jgi:hypothetical protein
MKLTSIGAPCTTIVTNRRQSWLNRQKTPYLAKVIFLMSLDKTLENRRRAPRRYTSRHRLRTANEANRILGTQYDRCERDCSRKRRVIFAGEPKEVTEHDAANPTSSVATPIVATSQQDGILAQMNEGMISKMTRKIASRRDATKRRVIYHSSSSDDIEYNAGKPTPSVATSP